MPLLLLFTLLVDCVSVSDHTTGASSTLSLIGSTFFFLGGAFLLIRPHPLYESFTRSLVTLGDFLIFCATQQILPASH